MEHPRNLEIFLTNIQQVNRDVPCSVSGRLEEMAYSANWQVKQTSLRDCLIPPNSRVVMLAESERTLLANIEETEFEKVKHILGNASSILWITNGGLLKGKRPKFAMARGLARSIISEQASIKFTTLDIDLDHEKVDRICEVTLATVEHQVHGSSAEDEIILSRGRVYINRVIARNSLNKELSEGIAEPGLETLEQGQKYIGHVNRSLKNAIVFTREDTLAILPANKVQIEVKALGVTHEVEFLSPAIYFPSR